MERTAIPAYQKLADVNEIRLLHLQPGLADNPIVCQMVHSTFPDYIRYEALSYMWGSDDSPLQIELNGSVVEVRNNLWQALKHIRLTGSVRILWIDALCINQHDINERNHQVSQMGRIYKNAIGVVAWLGLSDDASRIAMKYITEFRLEIPETRYSKGVHWASPLVVPGVTIVAIRSFCTREYWTRLWIIQELVVASHITLHCGDSSFTWLQFSLFLETAAKRQVVQQKGSLWEMDPRYSPVIKSVPMNVMSERKLAELKSRPSGRSSVKYPRPLVELCIDFGSSNCEDRRDKVFGLQAFTMDCCRDALAVDYSSFISEISWKLLAHYASEHEQKSSGGSRMAGYAQELHKVLRVTKQDLERPTSFTKALHPKPATTLNDPVSISAFVRGRITYLSPRLSDIDPQKRVKIPSMAFPKNLLPHNPECTYSTRWEGDLRQAQELNVVCHLTSGDSKFSSSKALEQSLWVRRMNMHRRRKFHADDSAGYFEQVVRYAGDAAFKSGAGTCRLAVDELGLIFFAPTYTRIGDFVCQSYGSDILMIARKPRIRRGHELIGRGVNVFETLRFKDGVNPCSCSTEPAYKDDTFAFSISIATLQRMTMASEPTLMSQSNPKSIELVLLLDKKLEESPMSYGGNSFEF